MVKVNALDQYRSYLEAVEEEVGKTAPEDYIDLLTPGEIGDLLTIRDQLASQDLSPDESRELEDLDDLLVKHSRLITENISPLPGHPQAHWWWYLHQGPQVRDEARRAA